VRQTFSVVSATTYTASVYVKRGNNDWVQFIFWDGTNGVRCWFNLGSGSKGTSSTLGTGWTLVSAGIVSIGNGWFRISVSGVTLGVSGQIYISQVSGDNSTTRVSGATYYLWGAQCEANYAPTSYIPTTTSPITRNADDLQIDLASLAGGGIQRGAGTLLAWVIPGEWAGISNTISRDCIGFATNDFLRITGQLSTFERCVLSRYNGVARGSSVIVTGIASGTRLLGGSWSAASVGLFANGRSQSSDTSIGAGIYNAVTTAKIGASSASSNQLDGWVHVRYWPRVLNASEMATLAKSGGYFI
jgi:hypothetical protein